MKDLLQMRRGKADTNNAISNENMLTNKNKKALQQLPLSIDMHVELHRTQTVEK